MKTKSTFALILTVIIVALVGIVLTVLIAFLLVVWIRNYLI